MDKEGNSNSLLGQLQNKLKKGGLKPTTTKTTFPDGSIQYFSDQGSSNLISNKKEATFGFVVDTKPDLTIGRVTPWLFVSSQDVPGDKEILTAFEITHIVSLLPGFTLPSEAASIVASHLVLEVYDEECFSLESEVVTQALHFISDAKKADGKILVHCNAGISRAPSLVIAYLMKRENLSLPDAWEKVKLVRPSMRPNAGFVKQLEEMNRLKL